jgi:2-dehydropantoate 2-reductase
MRVLVFGAGAVGSYLGGRLGHAGHDITLVARLATVEALKSNGLSVTENGERVVTRPHVVASLRQAFLDDATYDVALVAMKSYDVDMALNEMVAFCPAPPPLLTLQNGIGIEEKFAQQFGAGRVTAASLTTPITLDSTHSVVVERSDRGLAIAPVDRRQRVTPWLRMFQEAGVPAASFANYRAMKWSKALLNLVGNASAAILNRHPGLIYSTPLTFRLEMRMLQEALAVMRKLRLKVVDLPGSPARRLAFAVKWLPHFLVKPVLAKIVTAGRGNKMPSFHLDLAAGKEKNEVLYHNGAIAQYGRASGVPTPVNAALSDILLKLGRKELDWREFEGNPKRLLAEVRKYRQVKERSSE